MKKIIIIWLALFLSNATAQNDPIDYISFKKISNLDFSVFNNPKYSKYYNKKYNEKLFLQHFYSEWNNNETKHTISKNEWLEFFTYFETSKNAPCYAGNYRKFTKEFLYNLTANIPSNKRKFPHFLKKGILVKTADLRGLPTKEFCFRGMRDAGESYPFDNLQYSSIWIGTPITILSKTKDGLWYFVSTPNNKGWVESEKVAFVSDKQSTEIQNKKLGAITKDNCIVQKDWNFVELHIGTILPIDNQKKTSVLIPYKSFEDNYVVFKSFKVDHSENFQKFPLIFNAKNTKKILSDMLGGKYSWGGIDGGRDCSSTLKDYLTPFGIWLPRNSSQQVKRGEMITLSGDNKEETIIEQGIPFLTSVYKRGHIMLYVGLDKRSKTPLIYQTVWGIKAFYKDFNLMQIALQREKYGVFGIDQGNTFNNTVETRFIIGGTVITPLEPTSGFNKIKGLKVTPFVKNLVTMTIFSDK